MRRCACHGPALAADEEALPFAPRSFDLALSALSLHWVNDLPGTLIQLKTCLRPDGLLLAALLGGESLHELRVALTEAELEVTGGLSPRVSPFAEEQDWRSYRAATELCREIGASDHYADFRAREALPQKDGALTDAEWREFLSASVNTYFHPTSTCQIGRVVDPELKVMGIEGLRVADASVMPHITTSNTTAPTMMIGWRAGSMIASR